MQKKHIENKTIAIVKAVLGLVGTLLLYFIVFTNTDTIKELLHSKSYLAPLTSMAIVLIASSLYGTAVAKILKNTLQERLKSQELREE